MQVVVNISRLRHNIRNIRMATRKAFCAVVKSDAYGHGMAVAPYIEPLADAFLVANYTEANTLVMSGIKKPILVLGGESDPPMSPNIIPTVASARALNELVNAGVSAFSVEIDTGMHRLGANEKELNAIAALCSFRGVKPFSVYSHIYNGVSSAGEQALEFERLTENKLFRGMRHLYSSCALDLNTDLYDMTRMGIAMYGFGKNVTPCIRARAKIVAVNEVSSGSRVGYGDYILDSDRTVATVKCGYADGLRRCDKQLYLTVRGQKCNILGSPCMDLTMIDVTGVPCRVGEYAYYIYDKNDVLYLAKCYGTIIYEVLTGLNGRAQRFYV